MNRSSLTPIDDELLSAYIDGLVTAEERTRVEAAVAADPALAWELASLRQTVELVRDLPALPLPRSFVLTEEQVADVLAERRARTSAPVSLAASRRPVTPSRRTFWQGVFAFFNSGNLLLRNAAAVAALFFVAALVASPAGPVTLSGGRAPVALESAPAGFAAQPEQAPLPAVEASAAPSPNESAAKAASVAEAEATAEDAGGAIAPSEPMAAALPAPIQPESAVIESSGAPAMRSAPAFSAAGGMGGGLESGPLTMQAVPANRTPPGDFPPPESGIATMPRDIGPEFAATSSGEAEFSTPVPLDSAADEAMAEGSGAESSAAEEVVVIKPEAVAQEGPAQEPLQTPAPTGWTTWRLAQAALGGLVLLLGLLWLGSRQP